MAGSGTDTSIDATKPILIIGAGVVGLTLAQGCREAGIPFRIFEQHEASSERSQGWGLTLHWSLNSLERTIGPQLTALLPQVSPTADSICISTNLPRPMSIRASKKVKAASSFSMLRPASLDTMYTQREDFCEQAGKSCEQFSPQAYTYNMGRSLSLL